MTNIAELFALGLQQHSAGNLAYAEHIYRQVLECRSSPRGGLQQTRQCVFLARASIQPFNAINKFSASDPITPQPATTSAWRCNAKAEGRMPSPVIASA